MSRKSLLLAGVAGALILSAAAGWLAWSNRTTPDAPPLAAIAVKGKDGQQVASYVIPQDRDILAEANAGQIIHGKRLLAETARLLPDNVGNGLNCNSCHLADGKVANANPYINTVNSYPRVMPRAGQEVDLVGRINGCFQRSMNGRPLAPESAEMEAMIAYMEWLRQGVEKGDRVDMLNAGLLDESLVPDPVNGERIYAAQCAMCHGDAGEGMQDQFGDYIFPPLWGDESFNIGAGLARTYKAAQYVKYAMPPAMNMNLPLGQGGVLTDQEAIDVSEYFTHMPRPDFAPKVNDWPDGNKPKDARY